MPEAASLYVNIDVQGAEKFESTMNRMKKTSEDATKVAQRLENTVKSMWSKMQSSSKSPFEKLQEDMVRLTAQTNRFITKLAAMGAGTAFGDFARLKNHLRSTLQEFEKFNQLKIGFNQFRNVKPLASLQNDIKLSQQGFEALRLSGKLTAAELADYFRAMTAQVAKAQAQINSIGLRGAPKAITNPYGTTGVMSRDDLKTKLTEQARALQVIRESGVAGSDLSRITQNVAANMGKLVSQYRGVATEAKKVSTTHAEAERSFSGFNRGVRDALAYVGALYVAYQSLKTVFGFMYDMGVQSEQLSLAFKAIKGSTSGANQELDWLRQTSNRLGVEFYSTADGFKQLSAAAMGTTMEGAKVRDVYEGIVTASTAVGLSSEQMKGALYAVEQMISKGTVSMEELRRQLGNQLPGAFQIAAESMGVTTGKLMEMIKAGSVLTEDFLPKFAATLKSRFATVSEEASNTLARVTDRFTTAFKDLFVNMNKGGFAEGLKSALSSLTDKLKSSEMQEWASSVGKDLAKTVSVLVEFVKLATGLFTTIVTGWGSLPPIVKEVGLLAAIIGPWQVKAIMAGITLISGAISGVISKTREMLGMMGGEKSDLENYAVAQKEQIRAKEAYDKAMARGPGKEGSPPAYMVSEYIDQAGQTIEINTLERLKAADAKAAELRKKAFPFEEQMNALEKIKETEKQEKLKEDSVDSKIKEVVANSKANKKKTASKEATEKWDALIKNRYEEIQKLQALEGGNPYTTVKIFPTDDRWHTEARIDTGAANSTALKQKELYADIAILQQEKSDELKKIFGEDKSGVAGQRKQFGYTSLMEDLRNELEKTKMELADDQLGARLAEIKKKIDDFRQKLGSKELGFKGEKQTSYAKGLIDEIEKNMVATAMNSTLEEMVGPNMDNLRKTVETTYQRLEPVYRNDAELRSIIAEAGRQKIEQGELRHIQLRKQNSSDFSQFYKASVDEEIFKLKDKGETEKGLWDEISKYAIQTSEWIGKAREAMYNRIIEKAKAAGLTENQYGGILRRKMEADNKERLELIAQNTNDSSEAFSAQMELEFETYKSTKTRQIEVAQDMAKATKGIYDELGGDIKSGLGDVIVAMMDGASDRAQQSWSNMWQNLKSSMVRYLIEMAMMMAKMYFVIPVVGKFMGTSGMEELNSTSGGLGLNGSGKGSSNTDITSMLTKGMDTKSIISGIDKWGYDTLGIGTGISGYSSAGLSSASTIMQNGGSAFSSYGALKAADSSAVAAMGSQTTVGVSGGLGSIGMGAFSGATGGFMAGQLFRPDTPIPSIAGGASGAIAGGLAASGALGAAAGAWAGPIGMAVGALVSGIIGGAMGETKKTSKTGESGITINMMTPGATRITGWEGMRTVSSGFMGSSSTKHWKANAAADPKLVRAWNEGMDKNLLALESSMANLNLVFDSLNTFTFPIEFDLNADNMEDALYNISNAMAEFTITNSGLKAEFDAVRKEGEMYIDELKRLGEAYSNVAIFAEKAGTSLALLSGSNTRVGQAGYASSLIERMGSAESVQGAFNLAMKYGVSKQDQARFQMNAIGRSTGESLGRLGVGGVNVSNFWDNYRNALNGPLTPDQFAKWANSATMVDSFYESVIAFNTQVNNDRITTLQNETSAIEANISAMQSAVNLWKGASDALGDAIDAIRFDGNLSNLNPQQIYEEKKAKFLNLAALAKGGDAQAATELASFSRDFIEESRSFYGISTSYYDDFAVVMDAMTASKTLAELQYSTALQQLEAANRQIALNTQQITELQLANQNIVNSANMLAQAMAAGGGIGGHVSAAVNATNVAQAASAAAYQAATAPQSQPQQSPAEQMFQAMYNAMNPTSPTIMMDLFGGGSSDPFDNRASGGLVTPGLYEINEDGNEIIQIGSTGRVYNAGDTQNMLSGGDSEAVEENTKVTAFGFNALISEVASMRKEISRLNGVLMREQGKPRERT